MAASRPEGQSPMNSRPETYAEWTRSFIVRRWGILIAVSIVAWSTYLARDVATFGWGSEPSVYRLVGASILVAMLLVHRTRLVRRYLDPVLVLSMCSMTFTALSANIAALELRGVDTIVQFEEGRFGIATIFVFAAAIVPARWPAHAVIQAVTVAFFALHWDIFGTLAAEGRLVWGLQGLFWLCFVCNLSIFLYSRLQRSEFEARRELEEVSREREAHLDALVGVGISATSADPAQQARAALDELIRALNVDRAWLYLRDAEGHSRLQVGRDAAGGDLAETSVEATDRIELPLRMHGHEVGTLLLAKDAGAAEVSVSDDHFLRALASHVAIALETVRSTEELRVARDRALDAGRAKDAFLQTMSHELRTPLNAMIGYSEMLQEDLNDAGEAERAADAEKIQHAAAHLLEIIADILELTKLESDRHAVSALAFSVTDLVSSLEPVLRPLAEERENVLEFVVAEDVGAMCSDPARVETILRKLLENACKFTRQGKVVCHVSRALVEGVASLRFRVSDTGIGMNEEQLARCFEPFYQADPSATRAYGGTGLGLTTARRLCEMLGGRLTANGTPGHGAVFELVLPAS
jgi:signal transduction histidine kinase